MTVSDSFGGYRSYVVAGLVELAAQGLLTLRYAHLGEAAHHRDVGASGIWMLVEPPSGGSVRVFFDLADYPEFARCDELEQADVYFKRSYRDSVVARLAAGYRAKVSPMTIQYGCRSRHESRVRRVQRAAGGFSMRRRPAKALRRVIGAAVQPPASYGPLIEDFEVLPHTAADATVYLRTRLYDPQLTEDPDKRAAAERINDFRVRLIEGLRDGLGPKFVGGLYPTEATLRLRPDLVDEVPPGRENFAGHLQRSHASVINVSQAGVRGSTGWKLAECMAASRCLVSQPPVYRNLDNVIAGEHFAAYETSEECVAVCLELLSDPERVCAYRRAAFDFYRRYMHPRAAMARLLQAALSRVAGSSRQATGSGGESPHAAGAIRPAPM